MMVCTHSGDEVLLVSLQWVQTLWELQQCGCSILGPAGHQSPMLLHTQAVQRHVAHLSRSRSKHQSTCNNGDHGEENKYFPPWMHEKKNWKKCCIYYTNNIILRIATKIQQWSYLDPYVVVAFPSWTLWESPGLSMIYAIAHWQMHSIGWEDCVHDCNFNTPPCSQPLPSSEDLSLFQEGGCCHARSLSWLKIITKYLCSA